MYENSSSTESTVRMAVFVSLWPAPPMARIRRPGWSSALRLASTAPDVPSIGTSTPSDALHRVFGSGCHAHAPALSSLSPRMDELFFSALRELAAPRPKGAAMTTLIT
jgi:hypothetical protein